MTPRNSTWTAQISNAEYTLQKSPLKITSGTQPPTRGATVNLKFQNDIQKISQTQNSLSTPVTTNLLQLHTSTTLNYHRRSPTLPHTHLPLSSSHPKKTIQNFTKSTLRRISIYQYSSRGAPFTPNRQHNLTPGSPVRAVSTRKQLEPPPR